jgi:hypothetical protein
VEIMQIEPAGPAGAGGFLKNPGQRQEPETDFVGVETVFGEAIESRN